MEDIDWYEMKEKVVGLISLCVSDEAVYYILDQLVTTLTYEKVIIGLDLITATTLSHSRWRESVEEITQGDDMYVRGSRSWVDQR